MHDSTAYLEFKRKEHADRVTSGQRAGSKNQNKPFGSSGNVFSLDTFGVTNLEACLQGKSALLRNVKNICWTSHEDYNVLNFHTVPEDHDADAIHIVEAVHHFCF